MLVKTALVQRHNHELVKIVHNLRADHRVHREGEGDNGDDNLVDLDGLERVATLLLMVLKGAAHE